MIAARLFADHAEPEELEDPRAQAHFERAAELWQAGDFEGADAELAAVPVHVGLGPHIMRAETAAVAAAAMLSARRSGHLPTAGEAGGALA